MLQSIVFWIDRKSKEQKTKLTLFKELSLISHPKLFLAPFMSYFNFKSTCHYLSEWNATSQNVVPLKRKKKKRKKNRMHIGETVTSLFQRDYIFLLD